jgi:K+-sensing histidine kinase KdpD
MTPGQTADPTTPDAVELGALREIVQLAAGASTWDELMQLIVDRSTDAMRAEVCSLYLVDRDGAGLTLAATNGVDREHIGVARLDIGQGITGLAASTRGPVVSTDLANDPRCAWIRGVDHERFTSILAVPLEIGDQVVGVLNVKTEARRDFGEPEVRRLSTIASLLAGVVERRRLHLETEAQLDGLRSVDQARAELIAVVTHQLRTPLAVVRAYLDLLAETAESAAPEGAGEVGGWHEAATGQLLRLNEMVDTILETVRADRLLTVEIRHFDVGSVIDEVLTRLAPLLRRHRLERYATGSRMALGDPGRLAQVLELLLENAAKYAPPGAEIMVADWSADGEVRVAVGDAGPGVPREQRESVFEPFVRLNQTDAPGAGVGLFAARRLVGAMDGRLWIEDKPAGGSQFVTALPEAGR